MTGRGGARWRTRGAVAGLAVFAVLLPHPVASQDLEVVAAERGIPLPDGYWERKAADPLAFELPNGFFGGREALPPVRAPGRIAQPASAHFTGTARFPVVLGLFADSREPWIAPEEIDRSLFSGPAAKGTLTEFYSELSYGQFTVAGDVLPWVRTSLTMAEVVGADDGLGDDSRVGDYLMESLSMVDGDVDFRLYDNDGPDRIPDSGDDDGVVDVVTFEFQEGAASCGGPAIWPHRWGISGWTEGEPWASDDIGANGEPIVVDAYIIQGATNCGGTEVQIAATIAHEFGHALGLPDYYHAVQGREPQFRRWVLGCWELMAAGSWGCGPVGSTREPFGPTMMTAWNRHVLGWLDFDDVGVVRDTVVSLAPIRTSGHALRIPLDGGAGEAALLLEYRDHQSFDADTPGPGVLVVRFDADGLRRPQTGLRYRLYILEADGDRALLKVLSEGGDRGMPSDAFGLPGGPSRLNNVTDPSTRAPDGALTSTTIHSIRLVEGGAEIHLSTDPVPALVAPAGTLQGAAVTPIDHALLVAGGTPPFDVTFAGAPAGVTLAADGDRVVFQGEPEAEGAFVILFEATDQRGESVSGEIQLDVGPLQIEIDALVDHVVERAPLSPARQEWIDARGNANGNLDVGDLRAWRYGPGQ